MRPSTGTTLILAATIGVLLAWLPLAAHHGTNISYDRSLAWTTKAVVTDFKYVNPHAQLYFDVVDDKQHAGHWSAELLPNPAQLIRNGWTKKRSVEALATGTTITVTVAPARAGGTVVLLLKVVNEKGEELLSGGPDAGGPETPQRGAPPQAGR